MQWTVSDLKAVLKFEKSKDDGKMPSKKRDIAEMYARCLAKRGSEVVIEAASGAIVRNEEATVENQDSRVQNDDMKTSI